MFIYRYVTFLSLNKKVTKELSIGEALNGLLPQSKSPSLRIYPTRNAITAQNLNDRKCQTYGLTIGSGSALTALPILPKPNLHAENRNIFCMNRI